MSRRSSRPLLAVLLASVLALGACSAGKDAVDQQAGGQYRFVNATKKGELIPVADRKQTGDANGTLLDGRAWQLSGDRGKVVVINYWGSWCGPCVTESPQLDAVYRDVKAKGVDFVGIDVKDDAGSARAFVRDKHISYPIVYDETAKTALQLGKGIPTTALPVTIVVDKDQRAAAVYLGPILPADLQPVLTKLIAET